MIITLGLRAFVKQQKMNVYPPQKKVGSLKTFPVAQMNSDPDELNTGIESSTDLLSEGEDGMNIYCCNC